MRSPPFELLRNAHYCQVGELAQAVAGDRAEAVLCALPSHLTGRVALQRDPSMIHVLRTDDVGAGSFLVERQRPPSLKQPQPQLSHVSKADASQRAHNNIASL